MGVMSHCLGQVCNRLPETAGRAIYQRYGSHEFRNGVLVPSEQTAYHPKVKIPNVKALHREVRETDYVTCVGGGFGVTAVHAALQTTQPVTVFEGSDEMVELLRDVAVLNGVTNQFRLKHATVGEPKDLYSEAAGADTVHPSDLPYCNVLELDCEGSELGIIRQLSRTPRVVIVETHPELGASTEDVRDALVGQGYGIDLVEPDKHDGDVITATQ